MSRLQAIAATLRAIQAKLPKHPAFLKQAGSMPDDPSHTRDREELFTLQQRLAISIRELESQRNMLDLREQVAFKIPREQRFREKQSLRDKGDSLQAVYQLATSVLREVEDLIGANSRPPIADIVAAIVEQGLDPQGQIQVILLRDKGHHDALKNDAQTVQNIPAVFMMAVLLGYLCVMGARKVRSKSAAR
jgi:hypothetical protein